MGSLEKEKNFVREKRGRLFSFQIQLSIYPFSGILYPEEDQVRRGIVHQNRGGLVEHIGQVC